MKRQLLFAILFAGCLVNAHAQTEPENTVEVKKEKRTNQFVAVQLNGLIRQVFNFNNSTANSNINPYLVTYNINSRKSGWGLRVGIGYNYSSNASNDGITDLTTKINDLQFRFGIEKAFKLSDKWSAGVGLDALVNTNDDKTTSIVTSFDTITTDTKTKINSYGGGCMGWLRYHITDKITIGTEASIYYLTGKQENTVVVTEKFGGSQPFTTTTTSKPTVSQANINLPIVFYLAVRF